MPPAIIGGVIAGVGAIGGAVIGSSASHSAANAQAAQQQAAIDYQKQKDAQTRGDLAPYRDAGQEALGMQGALLGLNGAKAQQMAIQQLQGSPLYKSLFNNGQDTLLANVSATGGLRGGNTQGALANFGRDTLSGVIENQLSNLGGVSALGQNSAVQTGNFGQNSANSISNLLGQKGSAQASGILGSAGSLASGLNGAAGSLAQLLQHNGGGGGIAPGVSNYFAPTSALTASAGQAIAANPSIF